MTDQHVMRASGDYRELDEYFQETKAKKWFLVCGNSIRKLRLSAYFDTLENRTDIQLVRFSGFRPNPLYEDAVNAVEVFRSNGCDAVAAVGGGSAIDVAKCVKLWANSEAPFLAVPTTAGTGSEATRYAVIYRQGEKQSISHENCIPSAVLLDPSALDSLPDYHRKSSMLDALCHAVESFWSIHATAESREYARKALRLLLENVDGYLTNTPVGNAGMLESANLAGKAIDRTQTTAGHAMCYKLTTLYGLAHGHAAALCVSKLWPYMAEKAAGTELEATFQELARAMGCKTVPESIARFQGLLARLELETPAPKPEDYEVLRTSVNPVRLKNNPVPLDLEAIDGLYHQILPKEAAQ